MKSHEIHHAHPPHGANHAPHAPKPAEQNAEVYVGIPEPAAVRRPVLEAARLAILAHPIQERLLAIQDQKLTIRTNLAQTVKDMRTELAQLKMVLPHREIQFHAPEKHLSTVSRKKQVEHKVDKIAEALAAIEERMKSL